MAGTHLEPSFRAEHGRAEQEVVELAPAPRTESPQALKDLQRESRDSGLRLAAVRAENDFLVENVAQLQAEGARLQTEGARLQTEGARLQAEVVQLMELVRSQRADLDEAHAFIRHCEETIANCQRELARSPFHKAKRITAALLRRFGLLDQGETKAKTTAAAIAPGARNEVRGG